ncbi:F-box domain-containing protein [Emericellopsis atlantica]|uniref:F-box domain-containing protein n=1 Tax=Emericellopsis atlantica TaxID=2614577 RepID=A0A9P7ZE08_9HYPO|nr:F-box domain-containing protein [Emericellopsis atlantica]KAG9250399.1 F-box domain-containing protein [Emericellopsis atlantica]
MPSPRKRCKLAHDTPAVPQWPASEIPVEIFEIIVSHLSRSEIRSLRLVCREFEDKVSSYYFRNVVVPFRSELYGTLPPDETGVRQHPSSALFSNGGGIFKNFGHHILRFALSLELDEDALAYPPVKAVQEALPAFWGIYRWPHQSYNRYTDLQSIEQTADETQSLKHALWCLTKVTNLGLCCDAGLGFLVRPDTEARSRAISRPVFTNQNWRRGSRQSADNDADGDIVTLTDFNGLTRSRSKLTSDSMNHKERILERMMEDVGYRGQEVDEAIQILLATEHRDLESLELGDDHAVPVADVGSQTGNATPPRPRYRTIFDTMAAPESISTEDVRADDYHAHRTHPRPPLMPADLTLAQKELLLELEWAHRAMIQSYFLAIADQGPPNFLQNLTTLTFASIPSCQVQILNDPRIWLNLPQVSQVSLGVIADWRRIVKRSPGCIDDVPVSPVEAVGKVYNLINNCIGPQSNIESLHFEWICGGEFAPSSAQRNQYVLPAPVVDRPRDLMVNGFAKDNQGALLFLPHIKHLSLKNCWFTPDAFLQTIRRMGLASLEKLELESVSLSGPVTPADQPPQHPPVHMPVPVGLWAHNQPLPVHHPAQNNEGTAEEIGIEGDPRWFTWSHMVGHFCSNTAARDESVDRAELAGRRALAASALSKYVPDAIRLVEDEGLYKIRCASFKSCGYIWVKHPKVNTRVLMPPDIADVARTPTLPAAPARLVLGMQSCKDGLAGRILPYVSEVDKDILENVYGMRFGWSDVYDGSVIADAILDGIDAPGAARFTGVVNSPGQ